MTKRVFAMALLLCGGALSLAACEAPAPYAYNSYGAYPASSPSPYGATCGIYNSCAPKGGPMDLRGNPSGG
jgi:hypothetical protein